MSDTDLQRRIAEAIQNPKNMGELEGADAVGTVGNSDCGEMLRMWIKFKEEHGKKVIDRATFQSFGCETAIAVASLATELIRGKTTEQALSMSGEELAGDLGPLPPMKIHCSQLVEEALRSALQPSSESRPCDAVKQATPPAPTDAPSLLGNLGQASQTGGGFRIIMLDEKRPTEP
ncbi:MAG: iron-sulfur cluster assembly scaffold protein [Verrucomicrobia bacterium]|nr:iron-sulfur cluster assembly scaffold protein [Verrucomicrobiota bacterium]